MRSVAEQRRSVVEQRRSVVEQRRSVAEQRRSVAEQRSQKFYGVGSKQTGTVDHVAPALALPFK